MDLLAQFSGVRNSGDGWMAKCPAHDDRQASLSIKRGDRQPWLLKCHAGCDTDAIVGAAGLSMQDILEPRPNGNTDGPRKHVSTYSYCDERGTDLYEVLRYEPKDFRQRKADGTWSMKGVRRVAYHLDELQGQSVVYVVEGEKDADLLRHSKLRATCNAGGAGKWRDDYTEQLVKAGVQHVVILPDNDDPGRAHAEHVARSCHASGLQVKVVALPGLKPKGDVTDWLDAGHTLDELRAIVAATAVYTPAVAAQPEKSRTPIVTIVSTVEAEPVEWLWPGRFARGKYTLLAGEPGLGKTYLTLDTAARCSRGSAFPDGAIAPRGRTLILTAEDGLADTIRPRLDALGADCSQIAVLEAVREVDGTRSALSLVRDLDMLMAAVREVRPIVVGIDPFSAYLGRTDTHRDSEVRSALAPLLDMAEQERFALIGICHLSKDQQKAALHRPGGSIAFVAAARIVLALAADAHDPDRGLLASIKSNICRPAATLAYRITAERLAWEADAVEIDVADIFRPAASREDQTDAEHVIRDLLGDEGAWPMAARDAIEAGQAHGITERTMRWTAKKLGIRISRIGFGRAGKWVWHRPEPIPATTSPKPLTVAPIAAMEIPSEKEKKSLKSVHSGNVASVLETTETEAVDAGRF